MTSGHQQRPSAAKSLTDVAVQELLSSRVSHRYREKPTHELSGLKLTESWGVFQSPFWSIRDKHNILPNNSQRGIKLNQEG